jgi:hypothetical protein
MIVVVALIIVILGWLAVYLVMRASARRKAEQLRSEFQQQVDSLEAKLETLEQKEAAPAAAAAAPAVAAPPAPARPVVVFPKKKSVTPETIAVIAAAVTAALGKKVRIRSARLLQMPDYVLSPWAQQGRVFVQASHNLHVRGR